MATQVSTVPPPVPIPAPVVRLVLLGRFALECDGVPLVLGTGGRRLLALLALRGPLARVEAVEMLWPEVGDTPGLGRLRTVLWRVARTSPHLLEPRAGGLCLGPRVEVDLHRVTRAAARLESRTEALDADDDVAVFRAHTGELLPGWYDDWVLAEQERVRQMRLHGWEALARRLCRRGHYASAVDAALAGVRLDPLRESTNRLLAQIHIREGNPTEAARAFRSYAELLRDELGTEPSGHFSSLIGHAGSLHAGASAAKSRRVEE